MSDHIYSQAKQTLDEADGGQSNDLSQAVWNSRQTEQTTVASHGFGNIPIMGMLMNGGPMSAIMGDRSMMNNRSMLSGPMSGPMNGPMMDGPMMAERPMMGQRSMIDDRFPMSAYPEHQRHQHHGHRFTHQQRNESPALAELIEFLDRNFRRFDLNGNNRVTAHELQTAIRSGNWSPNERPMVDALAQYTSKNGAGYGKYFEMMYPNGITRQEIASYKGQFGGSNTFASRQPSNFYGNQFRS